MSSTPAAVPPMATLIAIMARLRAADGGCPWDLEQSFATIAPYTIEEAYEVADAIERGDLDALKDELGDLLFQVVYHARMAEELGRFDFDDVAAQSADKMVRRHPHVFGTDAPPMTAPQQVEAWEEIKASERAAKPAASSALDGVALALPALTRALKIQRRAARTGFDWTQSSEILAKLSEEIGELEAEMIQKADIDRLEDELGDVLFTVVNLARHLELDPERALQRATAKFGRRFMHVEQLAESRGIALPGQSAGALQQLWDEAKAGTANAPSRRS